MKKLLALSFALVLVFCLFTGCNNSSTNEDGSFALSSDVEFVCPFSAGGGSDLYARTAANIIGEMGLIGDRTITINNKTGAGGAVGDAYTATKSPDGTTITSYVSAQITSPLITGTGILYSDLTPICNLAMDEYTLMILPPSSSRSTVMWAESCCAPLPPMPRRSAAALSLWTQSTPTRSIPLRRRLLKRP